MLLPRGPQAPAPAAAQPLRTTRLTCLHAAACCTAAAGLPHGAAAGRRCAKQRPWACTAGCTRSGAQQRWCRHIQRGCCGRHSAAKHPQQRRRHRSSHLQHSIGAWCSLRGTAAGLGLPGWQRSSPAVAGAHAQHAWALLPSTCITSAATSTLVLLLLQSTINAAAYAPGSATGPCDGLAGCLPAGGQCPPGRFLSESSICGLCPAGCACPGAVDQPAPCQPGFFAAAAGEAACSACPIDSYQADAGRSWCEHCPPDSYAHFEGSSG